ncbi:2-amino-4-hydroxy-6-hydroxymethyldihydropteridine diphosphokinase [Acidobacteriota bacterium]
MIYHIGLGSNCGDREGNIYRALDSMKGEGLRLRRISSLYKTQPVDFIDQREFYNLAAEIECDQKPEKFLNLIKELECRIGRTHSFPKGPRVIDIDILLAEDLVVSRNDLQIPHPRMTHRNFVLVPLSEIASEVVHPVLKQSIASLLHKTPDVSRVEPVNTEEEHVV